MFGLTFAKTAVIVIVALFLIGPERLPLAATRVAQLARTMRRMADTARDRVDEELGPEFRDVDWTRLDPRRYDPRLIIRNALRDDPTEAPSPPTDDDSEPPS